MRLVVIAAVIAVCGAAQLDRSYLPPLSAQTAGGSPGSIQTPFSADASPSQGNQGLGGIPKGAYNNDFQGVVVDAAASGTRATEVGDTGLGAPRPSYGSQNSKVGDAAFESSPSADFRGQFPGANTQNQQGNGVIGQFNGQAAGAQIDQRFGQPSFAAQPAQPTRANAEQDRRAGIIRYENEVGTDTFNYAFETDNGIKAEESGVATNGVQAQGGFSYVGDDGQTYSVTYTADENGYKPVGAHLPTPPPIPKEILQALEKNAQDEAAGLKDDGSYDAQRYNAGSDYNESDNINGRYNGVQSNKGSGNISTASDATPSGTFIQNSAQPLNQPNVNTINTDNPVKLNELEEKYKKQSGILIINRMRPMSDVNKAGPSAQASLTVPSNNGFAQSSNFGQFVQSSANIESNNAISQSSFGNNAFSQSTFGVNNNFAQQQQTQTPGFGTQKLGYLPPVTGQVATNQNPSIQGSQVSETNRPIFSSSFPSQQFGQASSQQTSQPLVNSQAFDQQQPPTRPTVSPPSPTLSTPFPQPVSNTIQTQNRFQQQSQSFSRQPTPTVAAPSNQQNNGFGCCGKRLPEKPNNVRPVAQGFRRQNIPPQVDNNVAQTQSGLAPTNNFNNNAGTFESQQKLNNQPTGQLQQQVSLQNRLNQNTQTSPQFSTTTLKPFTTLNTFASQQQSSSFAQAQDNSYHYNQPGQPFRMPVRQPQQSSNNFPATSSNQFNKMTQQPSFSSQINGLSSSQQNFQASGPTFGNRQQTTRYPNPPTLAPIVPTVPSQQETEAPQSTFQSQQYNGVTLASASSFSSPTSSNQVNTQQQFSQRPLRPNFQQQQLTSELNEQRQEQSQTQFNAQPKDQTQTSFQSPQPTQAFPQQTTTISQSFQRPISATANQFDQNANSFQQKPLNFGQRQSFTQDFQAQTPVEPSTKSVPTQQYDGEIYEYNKPAETLPPPDSTPPSVEQTLATETPEKNEAQVTPDTGRLQNQFGVRPTANSLPLLGAQQNQFGVEQSQVGAQQTQFGAPQNQFGSQQNQLSAQQNQFSAQKNQFGSQQNQFGSQFLGAQQSSSPVAGQGEVFGGARKPPSFNSQMGYQY